MAVCGGPSKRGKESVLSKARIFGKIDDQANEHNVVKAQLARSSQIMGLSHGRTFCEFARLAQHGIKLAPFGTPHESIRRGYTTHQEALCIIMGALQNEKGETPISFHAPPSCSICALSAIPQHTAAIHGHLGGIA